jgi:hypothetical protein
MKKSYWILLFILSSAVMSAMENKSLFLGLSSLSSYLPTWFSSSQKLNESKLILDIRENKDKFENQLKLHKLAEYTKKLCPKTSKLFIITSVSPVQFFQYCYYQKFHETEPCMSLEQLKKDLTLLNECQKMIMDGYSALSAAMLAKDVSSQVKRAFIKELIDYQFKPTLKDTQLAEFIFYDEIMKEEQSTELKAKKLKTKFIHLLHPDSSAHWRILPNEVRKLIAGLIVQVLKQEEDCWLLPRL